ncbi:hypothetical protein C8Q77DRAFT_653642 [Trametes polyzona]|nr:hypothetical protein C8Q77DRAFT_653642 [Trametes polyzona]
MTPQWIAMCNSRPLYSPVERTVPFSPRIRRRLEDHLGSFVPRPHSTSPSWPSQTPCLHCAAIIRSALRLRRRPAPPPHRPTDRLLCQASSGSDRTLLNACQAQVRRVLRDRRCAEVSFILGPGCSHGVHALFAAGTATPTYTSASTPRRSPRPSWSMARAPRRLSLIRTIVLEIATDRMPSSCAIGMRPWFALVRHNWLRRAHGASNLPQTVLSRSSSTASRKCLCALSLLDPHKGVETAHGGRNCRSHAFGDGDPDGRAGIRPPTSC